MFIRYTAKATIQSHLPHHLHQGTLWTGLCPQISQSLQRHLEHALHGHVLVVYLLRQVDDRTATYAMRYIPTCPKLKSIRGFVKVERIGLLSYLKSKLLSK